MCRGRPEREAVLSVGAGEPLEAVVMSGRE
jgi:hypothetical protein